MHRHALSDTAEMASNRSSRAPSFTSDRPSVASSITYYMPSSVRPAPAYIAAAVASQIVTDHHNTQLHLEDAHAEDLQNAVFSEPALALHNAFLDQLLFSFLSSARSPSLTAIRPAIAHVLKPRLAHEAMEAADEELQGLLAGEDDEEFPFQDANAADAWDVDKVWKRTRLRIMVYTRLGELEDEDEERYVAQERRLSMEEDPDDEAGLVSWASAIFLTSVIEYIAEQTLLISGSAAFARMAAKMKKAALQAQNPQPHMFERLIIEESDAEKIALNSALGRLWRTWKKRVRSPTWPLSPVRGVRPVSSFSSFHHHQPSRETMDGSLPAGNSPIPEHAPTETDIAANIPLPIRDNDVNEIEVPGLAPSFEDEEGRATMAAPPSRLRRQGSLAVSSPLDPSHHRAQKARPCSMPCSYLSAREVVEPVKTPFAARIARQPGKEPYPDGEEGTMETPESCAESPKADADMVAFATSTGMGFPMSTASPTNMVEPVEARDASEQRATGNGTQHEPLIMRGKRMSIEKSSPVVRTISSRSYSPRALQTTVQTLKALSHTASGEQREDCRAIGVARTSDIRIRSTPTPTEEPPLDEGKGPGHGGFVEHQLRHSTSTPVPVQTPSARGVLSTPAGRSVSQQVVDEKSQAPEPGTTATTTATTTTAPIHSQTDSADSPAWEKDTLFTTSRASLLPALKGVEASSSPKETLISETSVQRTSPTLSSPKRSPTYSNRDAPTLTNERLARASTNESTHSHSSHQRSPSDKASVQRVGSSASAKKGGYTVTPTNRDSDSARRSRGFSGRMSEEDRAREFDSLVSGRETVKFTLTPQTVRDLGRPVDKMEEPTSSVTVHPRERVEKDSLLGTSRPPSRSTSRSKGPVVSQHRSSIGRKLGTKPLAREPRIQSESMRDFADFIRSTGPQPGQETIVQPLVNVISAGPATASASAPSLDLGRRTSLKQHGAMRLDMRPRSPAGLSDGHDDLIDFIRQGPPVSDGAARIPRNIAPFRSTADSDQFERMLANESRGTNGSVYGSTVSTIDSEATINSRTALIPSAKVQPAYSNTPQKLNDNLGPQLFKKRHRNKDPYAIDISDEDDDDEIDDQLTALPDSHRPAPPKQESIMDFLNDMEPPGNHTPQPFQLSEATIAAARTRQQQQSAKQSARQSAPSLVRNSVADGNGNASPLAYDSMAVNRVSIASSAPRAFKPKLQAREPAGSDAKPGTKTATSDLADFLRTSGPTNGSGRTTPVSVEKEKKRGFWRRR